MLSHMRLTAGSIVGPLNAHENKTDLVKANMESQYDYGTRAGVWRIFQAFKGQRHRSDMANDQTTRCR
jgi:hypothetical protein